MERLNLKNIGSRFKFWILGILLIPLLSYGAINTFDLLVVNRLDADNIRIDGNIISSTSTNGNITIDANGTGDVVFTDLTADTVLYLDSSKALTSSAVTPTELGYVSGITSSLQSQLNTKAPLDDPTFTGTVTIPVTASRALVTGSNSEIAASTTTATEIGFVGGLTMAVQTQLDAKVPKSIAAAKGDLLVATGSGTVAVFTACPDGQTIEYDSAQATGLVCSAGGGGAGGTHPVDWEELGNSPIRVLENGFSVYRFESGLSQELYYHVVVPAAYAAGSQIKLNVSIYSPGTSNTILIQSQSTLIRAEVDVMSSTTNQRTSTNSAITLDGTNNNEAQKVQLDLTDATGQINSVAVSPLDIIKIRVYRGSDSDTNDIRLLGKGSVVSWE